MDIRQVKYFYNFFAFFFVFFTLVFSSGKFFSALQKTKIKKKFKNFTKFLIFLNRY